MANLAAVIPAAKASLEVRDVEMYKPGEHELLIKNEVIAFNPVEYKFARLATFPISYPAIVGLSYAGTVEAIGPEVTKFKAGDNVAVRGKFEESFNSFGKRYGSYQRYVIARDETASKVPEGIDAAIMANLIGNLSTVIGLFCGAVGLDKPSLDGSVSTKARKVLIYGGTSSFGSTSVQYIAQAGYTVVTTTSPKHRDFVSRLGAVKIVDHTLEHGDVIKQLIEYGPYDIVVDSISLPNTVALNTKVLAAQGGGRVYTLLPAFGPETLPDGVTREFESWGIFLAEEKNPGLKSWMYDTYLPQAVASGKLIPLPNEKVRGGLNGVNDAHDKMEKGVSGVRLVTDPWE